MNDIESVQRRIAEIRADLAANPEKAQAIDAEADRHRAFIREAETAMYHRPPPSETRGNQSAARRRRPIFGDES